MVAMLSLEEPPDEELRQAGREVLARVNWGERSLKLERFALSYGVSSSDAKDPLQTRPMSIRRCRFVSCCVRGAY